MVKHRSKKLRRISLSLGIIFLLCSTSSFAQSFFLGGRNEYTWIGEFPNQQPLTVSAGYNWKNLELGSEYSNFVWNRKPYRIQELGIEVRYYANQYKSTLNCFLESNTRTQLYSNGKNGPVENYLPKKQNSEDPYSSFFNRVQLNQTFLLGVNVYYKGLMIYAAGGRAFEIWSYYYNDPNKGKVIVNNSDFGWRFKFGIRFYLSNRE